MKNRLYWVFLSTLCFNFSSFNSGQTQTVPEGFSAVEINTSLDEDAVGFAFLPDERIFLVHQFSGEVQLLVNGVLKSQPLLTVPDLETSSEKGLLGIAVDPDFPGEPYVYLFHSHNSSTNRVSRFIVEGDLQDPNSSNLSIDVNSQETLIDDMPANASNHNGGTLRFGSDKTLYISHGDDASRSQVQDLTTLNGKILRINRDGSIPTNNPSFPSEPPGKRDEIFAFGFRNPFRFNIDPETEQLFIGDVGQNRVEELDLSSGGENFGWPRFEGSEDFDTGASLIPPDPTAPIWEYTRLPGPNSVIGLAVYRQQDYPNDASFPPEYDGSYFYADFYHDWIRNIHSDGAGGWVSLDFGSGFNSPVDAALATDGSIYILEYGDALLKISFEDPTDSENRESPLPAEFTLEQNYPNPFNPSTVIHYELAAQQQVDLQIYNLAGQKIATLVNATQGAGEYDVSWSGKDERGQDVASGIYLYKLKAGDFVQTRKMILRK